MYIHIFLTSALVGGEWWPSRPGRFTPGERASGTHWLGGWVDLRAGLDDLEKRQFLTLPGLELRPLGRLTTVASRYIEYAIPALNLSCSTWHSWSVPATRGRVSQGPRQGGGNWYKSSKRQHISSAFLRAVSIINQCVVRCPLQAHEIPGDQTEIMGTSQGHATWGEISLRR
jgi:hypothetical protein